MSCSGKLRSNRALLLTELGSPAKVSEKFMSKFNWKSLALLAAVVAVGAIILLLGFVSTLRLPLLGWSGLAPLVVLVILTLISSRFTVPVTSVDGTSQTNKSVADAFIFLSVRSEERRVGKECR